MKDMPPPTSERYRAELRDAAARSRLEYEEQKQQRRSELKIAPQPKSPDRFFLIGDIAEQLTVLETQAADTEDAELSRALVGLRRNVWRVGELLAKRRAAYRETT